MKVYRTAGLTAVWRNMAKVDDYAIEQVNFPIRILGYILGILDPDSVETIAQRTMLIDSFIRKLKPKHIVEIGAGFSSRAKRFNNIKCYEFDLPYFKKMKRNIIPFEIGKDSLNLNIEDVLFIVEGVTMYLQKGQVISLLKQIKQYKGHILIDFFNKEYSTKEKNLREKIYKLLFKLIIGRKYLFDYRIENIEEGKNLLKKLGYKNVKYSHPQKFLGETFVASYIHSPTKSPKDFVGSVYYSYNIPKSLDVLFYGEM